MNNLELNNLEKIEQQKQVLQNDIIGKVSSNNIGKIKVYNHECGTGKTLSTLETLKVMDKKVLFVGLRVSDIEGYAKYLNNDNMLTRAGIDIPYAFAFHSKLYIDKISETKELKKLKNYQVLFITHEKYKQLSKDTTQRNKFTEGREVLIIDEFINMCNIYCINRYNKERLSDILHSDRLRTEYIIPIFNDILKYIEAKGSQNRLFCFDYDIKLINKLLAEIKLENEITKEEKKKLTDFFKVMKLNNNCTGYIECNSFYFADNSIKYWTLDKTIMLDASSQLNPYDKDKFTMMNQSKVLDHCNWTIYATKDNTTKSGKSKMVNFAEVVNEKINAIGDDTTLYIGSKSDEEVINCENINHFGNLTGSNDYKELSNVVVGHTPQIPYSSIIVQYLYYYNKTQSDFDKTFKVVKINTKTDNTYVFRFKDSRFETMRVNSIANEIYQGIKRVNRDMSKDSNVILLQHDVKVINKVIGLMKGVNIVDIPNLIEVTEREKKETNADRLITLLDDIIANKKNYKDLLQVKKVRGKEVVQKKMYKKVLIREKLEIDSSKVFNNLLNSKAIQEYIIKHKITINTYVLDFSKYKK